MQTSYPAAMLIECNGRSRIVTDAKTISSLSNKLHMPEADNIIIHRFIKGQRITIKYATLQDLFYVFFKK